MTDQRAKRRKFDLLAWLYDHRCFWCGDPLGTGTHDHNSPTVDELKPRARGGFRKLPNQVPAHRLCNMRRGDQIAPQSAFERHHAMLKAAGIEVEEL